MKESINCQEEKPSTAYSAFSTFLFAFCLRLLKRLNLWPTALLPQLYRFSLADELFCAFILPSTNQSKFYKAPIKASASIGQSLDVKFVSAGKMLHLWEFQFSFFSVKNIYI